MRSLREANALLRAGEYDDAMRAFRHLLHATPGFAPYAKGYALAKRSARNKDRAPTSLSMRQTRTVVHPRSAADPSKLGHRLVVVTPVFNGEKFLGETIRSVLQQIGDFEVIYIVKDGGSADGTLDIIDTWQDRVAAGDEPLKCKKLTFTVVSWPDGGLYDAIASAFKHSVPTPRSKDILTYLNADDVYAPDAFRIAVNIFSSTDTRWICGQHHTIDEYGKTIRRPPAILSYAREDILAGAHLSGGTLHFIQQEGTFWLRELYEASGGLRRDLKLAGDYDLWLKFARHTELLAVDRPLAAFRSRPGQLSENYYAYRDEIAAAGLPMAAHAGPAGSGAQGQPRKSGPVCFLHDDLEVREIFVPSSGRTGPEGAGSEENDRISGKVHPYLLPVASPTGPQINLYAVMLVIWHLRPAHQRRFPLQHGKSRDVLRFLAWCATNGRREYAALRELPAWDGELAAPLDLPRLSRDRWAGTHSLMAFFHGLSRHAWTLGAILRSAKARHLSSRHYWRGARHSHHAPVPHRWQLGALGKIFGSTENFARGIAMKKHRSATDEELMAYYGLPRLTDDAAADKNNATQPLRLPGNIMPGWLVPPRWLVRLAEPVIQELRRRPSQEESARVLGVIHTTPSQPRIVEQVFGVNLIGYARGELGIGEDIRQVAMALEAAGIPACILDFAPGKNISQAEESATRFFSEVPLYGINLFCLTGIETTRYVCERGLSTLEGRYNIGLWPWELPDWPESCRHAYACIDEIWGISEFTAHAHRFAAPRPVHAMGLPVELGPVGPETRQDFGLPENDYLYYFAFDINSSADRKNPEGLIAAFQKAFPRGSRERVGLVLKISHPETRCKVWRRIRRAARRDPRIHLVEKTLRRPQLLALFRACDCFVSLHRAEGFGRGLAEALLLGKQVVTTGYSGNVDFCREPRVALVRHRMVPLRKGNYMWGDGQSWAEPDLDHAAELMRSVRTKPRPCNGEDFPFHPAAVGHRYAARLREIWTKHRRDTGQTTMPREHPVA